MPVSSSRSSRPWAAAARTVLDSFILADFSTASALAAFTPSRPTTSPSARPSTSVGASPAPSRSGRTGRYERLLCYLCACLLYFSFDSFAHPDTDDACRSDRPQSGARHLATRLARTLPLPACHRWHHDSLPATHYAQVAALTCVRWSCHQRTGSPCIPAPCNVGRPRCMRHTRGDRSCLEKERASHERLSWREAVPRRGNWPRFIIAVVIFPPHAVVRPEHRSTTRRRSSSSGILILSYFLGAIAFDPGPPRRSAIPARRSHSSVWASTASPISSPLPFFVDQARLHALAACLGARHEHVCIIGAILNIHPLPTPMRCRQRAMPWPA
jgi:hypothetical protein